MSLTTALAPELDRRPGVLVRVANGLALPLIMKMSSLHPDYQKKLHSDPQLPELVLIGREVSVRSDLSSCT
jgi:hypothetical protein